MTSQSTTQRGAIAGGWRRHPLAALLHQRSLVWAFAQRDFRTRYRTSAIGWTWSLLQPLANLGVFALVFSLIFQTRAPALGNGEGSSYVLFLFTGFVSWNVFSGLVTISMTSLRESGSLLRKVAFPAWAPVLGAQLVQMVQVALELVVLVVWFLVIGNVGLTWFWAPALYVSLALFAAGLGLALSTANARFGDVAYIVGVALSALYFLTPILYPPTLIPPDVGWLRTLVEYQPVSLYVGGLHDALYSLSGPSPLVVLALLLLGAGVFALGLWVFDRTTEDVGELL
jgi:ABC-type polysaccharide/polyol phosphate export permease